MYHETNRAKAVIVLVYLEAINPGDVTYVEAKPIFTIMKTILFRF